MKNRAGFHNSITVNEINASASLFQSEMFQIRRVDYSLFVHYHPYTDELIEKLNREGLPAMMDVNYLEKLREGLENWYTRGEYAKSLPAEEIDISDWGPYSVYNWELFFHAPLTIAIHLSKNQRFAEAQKWFHYIFDPTSKDKPDDPQNPQLIFWKFLRFHNDTKSDTILEMLEKFAKGENPDLASNIQTWRDNPFQPHAIARTRCLAYQINVVMKYLDNLISWGDNLFRQDTMETTNEATQIYVLAANILGPKPQKVPSKGKREPKTYKQLKKGLDAFGNALIELENDFPFNSVPTSGRIVNEEGLVAAFGTGTSLYFCVPQDDKLLEYWDIVADRLFKLRHCLNIEGIFRQLPLFEPPIDPGMLVKAVAAGFDLSGIINNLNQPLSTIRGTWLLQKAIEISSEVKSLGTSLLSALEKGDSEHLVLMRQKHEMTVLNMVKDVKFLQWKEAEAATESLLKSRLVVYERFRHYKLILGNKESDFSDLKSISLNRTELTETNFDEVYGELVDIYAKELVKEEYRKETSVGGLMEFAGNMVVSVFGGELGKTLPLNKNENAELNVFLPSYDTFNAASLALKLAAPLLGAIPQFPALVIPWGVGAGTDFGGIQLKSVADEGSDISGKIAQAFVQSADRASRMAGYYRRAEDYVLQANSAANELMHYGRQIISSLIREQITKKEYDNHVKQIENAEEIQTFLNEKFTNEELYIWMQGEISKIYFNCYQFAFDTARRTEQTLKYDLMRKEFDDVDFIKFGYWDSARKGLLSGESLFLDLKRLELAYHEHNKREYEMIQHISLHRLDPMALLKLKATGSCEIKIPEWIYDMESPGYFMRRIKSVAVSIPCIVGPYTGVHCKLSLLRSSVRVSSLTGDYQRSEKEDDPRFRDFTGAIQSIVTSTAQNDSGMFEVSLKDERYLPFEGAGAISSWRLEIPNEVQMFDPETISDIILHIRYTCREAANLASGAITYLKESILGDPEGGLIQLFNINQEFPNEWYSFTSGADKLAIMINKDNFSYWASKSVFGDLTATICSIDWTKKRLSLATENPDVAGDETTGWTITVDNSKPGLKSFLNKVKSNIQIAYMAISYTATT